MAVKPPNPPLGFAHAALIMEALGAAAAAHSTSIAASTSSPLMPEPDGYPPPVLGLVQLLVVSGPGLDCERLPAVYLPRPRMLRKLAQSLVAVQAPRLLVLLQFQRLVSSTTTIFMPCPEIPALNRGVML